MFLPKTIKILKREPKNNYKNWLDLDAASTTSVAKEVVAAMDPYFSDIYFNPSSPHIAGQLASKKLLDSREEIADYFSVTPEDVIFTTSATEANNWIIEDCSQMVLPNKEKPHIIYSAIEHDSVIAPILRMEQRGIINTTILPVDNNGLIDARDLEAALTPNTVLVSIMGVNNETGTLEPLNLISQCLEKFRKQNKTSYPYFHSDGVQALNYFSWSDLKGIDVLTLSGHKIYGPKGIGGLVFLNHSVLKIMNPLIVGGHQEFNLRAGTENLPAIIGLAKAFNLLKKTSLEDTKYLLKIRSLFLLALQKENKNIQLNGNFDFSAPSIINCYFPGVLASDMTVGLSEKCILASPGAACSASLGGPSHVINAMYHDEVRAKESMRFSFDHHLRESDIKKATHITGELYNRLIALK